MKAFLILLTLGIGFEASAVTKTWVGTTGGIWTTAANWSPSGQPSAGDDVIIGADQSASITAVPTISLNSLTINGSCTFEASATFNTITVTGTFIVVSGEIFTMGAFGARLNFVLSSTGTGTISGTVRITSGGTPRFFQNNGDLSISSTGLIDETGASSFTLSTNATLRVGSAAGITTAGATGNIRTTTRTYGAGANYVYNGTANQAVGNGLTQNIPANLTINNPGNIVTLGASTSLSGTLTVLSGTLNANGQTNTVTGLTTVNGTYQASTATQTFNGGLSISGGTFTGSSGTIAVNGNLSIGNTSTLTIANSVFSVTGTTTVGSGISGSLTISSATGIKTFGGLITISAGGVWNNSGNSPVTFQGGISRSTGTFTAGSGIHTFNTNAQSLIGDYTIPNVTVSGTSLTNNNTLTVSTALSGTGSLTQGTNSTLTILGTSSITSLNASNTGNTVAFNGASQTINASNYYHLTINETGGTSATLGGSTQVSGTLNLTAGNVNIGSNSLSIGSSGTISGGSATTMILVSGGGELKKTYSGASSFAFPVGDNTGATDYSPVTINVTAGSFPVDLGVSLVDAKHPSNASLANFLSRYWNVTTTSAVTANVVGTYLAGDINGVEASTSSAQLNGTFNQATNPWTKFAALGANTLTANGAALTAGQTSAFTGITGASPLVSITGGDVTICVGGSVPLTAATVGGDPSIVYLWSPSTGLSGTTVSNPTASPTVTTSYTVSIRDGNGILATSVPSTITVQQLPTTSAAGGDQNFCGTGVTLAANNPGVGTGAWSFAPSNIGVGGAFGNAALFNSTFTGTVGQTYILRWTISNGLCAISTDDVQVVLEATPSIADAGLASITQCNTSTFTMNATAPLVGSGTWTVFAGTATIINSTLETTTITGIAAGTSATLRWTVGNGLCATTFDDIVLTNSSPAPTANAGSDQTLCNTSSFTMSGNAPAPGTGTWTYVSGFAGITITTPGSNVSTITGLTAGNSVTLRWTITNGVCASTQDDVVLTNQATPSIADAGLASITQCNTSTFTMNATAPLVGSGTWTVFAGTATIINATLETTTITGIAAGTSATLRWTVGNGICATTFDDIVLTNSSPAPTANAGSDQTLCNTSSFTMSGNAPAPGTGTWTYVSGFAGITITTPGSNVSTITGLTAGNSVTLRWTITNGVCASTQDDVVLTNQATPSIADAGLASITQCNTSTFTMNATAPIVGSGTWTVFAGTATIINATLETTTITGIAAGTSATLRWTVGNGLCATTFDDIVLTNSSPAPTANAGSDQTLCNTSSFTMSGNAPAPGTGTWTYVSGFAGITITTPGSNVSTITGLTAGNSVTLRWTITNGVCASTQDDVVLTNQATPSIADAGLASITQCNTSTFTMNATAPLVGSGTWTVFAGTATIINATLETTTITGIAAGTSATLRWTVGNGLCATTFDDIVLTNSSPAPTANAGSDQTLCNTSSFTMSGNAPAPGTGTWTYVSGFAGITITTPGSNVSTITGLTAGNSVTLRWTITNGVCASTQDDVVLTNQATPSIADAGLASITQCNTSTFTMNATAPLVGSGTWTVFAGTATIINATLETTTITGIAAGTSATLRWTVGNGLCATTFDDIVLTNSSPAPTANAGSDQTLCNTSSFTMSGNAPAPGTGTWTYVSGFAGITITTPGSNVSTITGLTAGNSVTLRWTITNGVCASTQDDVVLTNQATPSIADAGLASITQCNTSTFTMNATAPLVGSGTWTVFAGTATIINATLETTTITGIAAGTSATLRWTVGNGLCATTFDDIVLTNSSPAPTANAGSDQTLCNTSSFTMSGNAPAPGTGTWTYVSGFAGITITTPGSNVSTITGLTAGNSVTLRWTITNGVCASTQDDVVLTNQATPSIADAGLASITQCNTSTFTMNATAPLVGSGTWTVFAGTATIINATLETTTITGIAAGTSATLRWTVGNGLCATTFDDIVLTNSSPAPTANAGSDQTLCNTSSFTMSGNAPAPGTGTWTYVSGFAGITITTPGSNVSTITGLTAGNSVTLRWTITNGVCASTQDDVVLTNQATPSIADAGLASITQCNTSTFTMNATAPLVGSGTWTVFAGTATIINATLETTTITGIAAGTSATLRWTVGNGLCATTFDDIVLTNSSPAPTANAGSDQTLCNTSSFTMSGNAPAPGTGTWTYVSGFAGITITTPGSNVSTITGLTAGNSVTLRWTITNGVCASTQDDVVLTNQATPSIADAGLASITQCNTSTFTMNATAPLVGSGTWTVFAGTATIINATLETTTITGIAAGTSATLRWTVGNGLCATTFDDIVLTNSSPAPTANAGSDQTLCNTSSFTMSGNAPAPGTGTWTYVSGFAGITITTPGSNVSTITGLTAGNSVTLRWTITNGVCASTQDDVVLTNQATPSIADAGLASITQCNTSTFTMNATAPLVGSGTWTVFAGTATIINATLETTTITGIAAGTSATLRWTVGNGLCATTFDDIVLTNSSPAPTANAGSDQTQCNTSTFALVGNAAAPGTGTWVIQSGPGTVTTPASPTSTVTGVTAGGAPTVVRWTISNGACGSFDEVTLINNVDPFVTAPSNQILCSGSMTSAVTFAGNASQYSWTNDNPSIGLPASGVGNIASFMVFNSGGSPVVATITITPSSGICTGTQQSFTITVNPIPVIDPISNIATGTGVVVGPIVLTTNTLGGENFSWSGGAAVGLPDGSGSSPIPSFTTINSGVTPISVVVSVIATKNGCPGPTLNFNVTVYPVPGALAGDQNICTGDYSSVLITATVVGTTFTWTVGTVTGTVTGQAAGSGPIIAQQLTSVAGGVVEYIITPTANGVAGPTASVFVGVLPTPLGNSVSAGTYNFCSGTLLAITPTSSVSGSTFTWTGNNGSGGSGDITDTPINTTSDPIDITYTVIPTGPAPTFCAGSPFTIVVTVNPNPSFTATNNAPTICSGSNASILFNSSTTGHQINVVSVNYNGAGNSGTIIPGTTIFTNGNTLTEALSNSTNAPIDVVYTFNVTTPSSTPICPLVPVSQVVTVRVYPVPNAAASAQSICSGSTSNVVITNPNAVSGTTFSWTLGVITGTVSGQSAGSGTTISQTLTSVAGGSVEYIITPSANGCAGVPLAPITVTVDPIPVGNSVAAGTHIICSGTSLNITPTLSIGTGTFTWSGSNGSGGSGNITDAPVNSTNSSINITYTVIPTGLGTTFCTGSPFTIVVTVNPNPSFTVTNNAPTICSGSNASILFNSSTTGHQINVVSVNYNGAGNSGTIIPGTTIFTNGNTLTETLSNSTNAPIDVVYTFNVTTPSSTPVCPLVPVSQVVTVRVYPVPNAAATTPLTICSGSNTSIAITNPNLVSGTTFTWTVVSPSNVTGASTGSGILISQFLTSTDGISTGTLTYRIIPTANGCSGSPFDVIVNVTPRPIITNPATNFIQDICSATALNFTPTSSVVGTNYTWTSTVIGTLSGVSASGVGAITDTPVNATNSNAVIIYTITPFVSGCPGNPVNLVVTVRPVPNVLAANQIICSNSSTSIVISNPNLVSGTTYTWTALATNANGSSSGSGNTISQVLTSADGLSNGTVDYTITPHANGCAGVPITITVTVKPVPVLTNTPASFSQQICSGETLAFTPTANIVGTSFTWTSVIIGTISSGSVTASGSGPITDTPVNTGNVSGTIRYTITPSLNSCSGLPIDLIVTVKPQPSASGSNVIVCSGQNAIINILPTPVSVSGTTFSWIASPSSNVVGSANGNGSTINQILSTTDALIGIVAYSITPSANGCNGPITIITATVNPIATVNAGTDFSVCETLSFPGTAMTIPISGTIGGSAASGSWTIVSGVGSISSSTTDAFGVVTATYTVGAGDIASQVKLRLTTNDPDLGGPCSIVSDDLTIDVHRRARITLPSNYTVCEPPSINLNGTLMGSASSGLWSLVSPGVGTLSASSVTGGLTVNAAYIPSYAPGPSDVNTTLTFRLTTNDPDGFGPCTNEFADIAIHINESAKVNAGADFEVCEDQVVNLNGSFSGSTTNVTWSLGGGAFGDATQPITTYTLTPANIASGGVTLRLTTNNPGAPCGIVFDEVFVKINKRPTVQIFDLDPFYAENDPPITMTGVNNSVNGGTELFSGPGVVGFNTFNPSIANAINVIRYTFTDGVTGCSNYVEQTVVVNSITSADFDIEAPGTNNGDEFSLCENSGINNLLTLIGDPPASTGFNPTLFKSTDPYMNSRIVFDGTNYKINTLGITGGPYIVQYIYTNSSAVRDTVTKELTIYPAPKANIDVGNACVIDNISFTESSVIPPTLTARYIWDFGDFTPKSTQQSPNHIYATDGSYTVTLEVITNEGQNCSDIGTKVIQVGPVPTVDFTWSKICVGVQTTEFKDNSSAGASAIVEYSWDFGDGITVGPGPGGSIISPTENTYDEPYHKYGAFNEYQVIHTVKTDVGCEKSVQKRVYILDYVAPSSTQSYFEDFEIGQGSWVNTSSSKDVNKLGIYSWVFGTPSGNVINSANSGVNAWWTGANPNFATDFSTYYPNDSTEVTGPCLNVSTLKRPMISMDYWSDADAGFDGAVVQYLSNGSSTWETIGDANGEGIEWYNGNNLGGNPGGQDNFGWTGSSSGWKTARFNLEQIPVAERDLVVFRIAFGSNNDNLPDTLNGFAFDNISIGEKKRNVLVEHFTNDSSIPSGQADQYLDDLYTNSFDFNNRDSSDFIKLQYHIANPGDDQINADNPDDPSARRLFYGVSQPPVTIMDGIIGDYYGTNFNGSYAYITTEELDRRSLEDPAFGIQIKTTNAPNNQLKLKLKYTYIDTKNSTFTKNVILHAALIETGVNGNVNSLRKLLLQGEGRFISTPWNLGDSLVIPIDYEVNVPIVDSTKLYIIAFVQEEKLLADKNSGRILQSVIVKAPNTEGLTIVGLPDDPTASEISGLNIYPNPASNTLNLQLDNSLHHDYAWKMIDQRGIVVLEGNLNRDLTTPQRVDLGHLADGIYFMAIQSGEKSVVYRKIAVINRD